MSDTPRTDAIAHRGYHLDALAARSIDLCRELERENAALRADKERLDWMEAECAWLMYVKKTPKCLWRWECDSQEGVSGYAGNPRDAIDAARKEAQP